MAVGDVVVMSSFFASFLAGGSIPLANPQRQGFTCLLVEIMALQAWKFSFVAESCMKSYSSFMCKNVFIKTASNQRSGLPPSPPPLFFHHPFLTSFDLLSSFRPPLITSLNARP